ncbi:MAG: hypothetical protein O2921_01185 [Chloroflexi bacterium]|nr:hypothetical protein [Chloroflexota bacterium]MDA1281233.1 hypothetical protein [Chloroflexota bacterium]
MQHHNNHDVGGKILVKGMEVQAQSKRNRHYANSRRRVSAKIKLLVMLFILVAFFWWVYGWGEPV